MVYWAFQYFLYSAAVRFNGINLIRLALLIAFYSLKHSRCHLKLRINNHDGYSLNDFCALVNID